MTDVNVTFQWSKLCTDAFTEAKQALVSTKVLADYDHTLPLRLELEAGASPYVVGAVISHVLPDGKEKPIAFASRTLATSEKNYAQLEKEALSLVITWNSVRILKGIAICSMPIDSKMIPCSGEMNMNTAR